MENHDQTSEKLILEAAEAEFLEKGYGNAKVIAIARRAGVSHSMLHYYFRSKEKLFQVVFESKVQKIAALFQDIFNKNLSFDQTIRLFIETQFNFMVQNPKLPHFILTEIISNKENRELLLEVLSPKAKQLATQFHSWLEQEVKRGTIRKIGFEELIINIVSINVFTFLAMPVLVDILPTNTTQTGSLLAMRCESNVQFILNSIRP